MLRCLELHQVLTPMSGRLIQGLCKEGRLHEALLVLFHKEVQGSVPSIHVYKTLLRACTKQRALAEAKRVHSHLAKHGFESHRVLGNLLVTTLIHCGGLADGLQLFWTLVHRTAFCWAAVISGYIRVREFHEALSCYEQMRKEGVQPDSYTFVSLLNACSKVTDLETGTRMHADAVAHGLASDVVIGNTLVHMYAKCGSIDNAQQVFDGLPERSAVSWNAMLAAYAGREQGELALQLYEQMQEAGVKPNAVTFVTAMQACETLAEKEVRAVVHGRFVRVHALRHGKKMHADATLLGFKADIFVGSTLVKMYSKCGSIRDAEISFQRLSKRDLVSWNALIAAYAEHDLGEMALQMFKQMQKEGVGPDARTFVSALQACGSLGEAEEAAYVDEQHVKVKSLHIGKGIHAGAARRGFDSNLFVGNTLVSMYAKCGSIANAEHVFNGLSRRSAVSWNALLAGYAQQEHGHKALHIYQQMQEEGVKPNARTLVGTLQACGRLAEKEQSVEVAGRNVRLESLRKGREIHAGAIRWGLEADMFVTSGLVGMYAKCGSIKDAEEVFDRLSQRDVVAWTAMIAAYVEQELGEQALQLYGEMKVQGVKAHEATFVSVLEACGSTGALGMCKLIHRDIVEAGLDESSICVATSLIHAYGKCGSMRDAQSVFNSLARPSVVTWNVLMAGYAHVGDGCAMALRCFEEMCSAGVKPTGQTFVALLSAFSHAGMVERGLGYFESMSRDHGILAGVEHYACVMDLVGRAGMFDKAEGLLGDMPMQPTLGVWLCLLAACRKHGNLALAKSAFNRAVELEPKHSAAYRLMSNLYADAGMQDCAVEVERLRQMASAWKEPGQSWIEYVQRVHTFIVGDGRHEQEKALHGLVKDLTARVNECNASESFKLPQEIEYEEPLKGLCYKHKPFRGLGFRVTAQANLETAENW